MIRVSFRVNVILRDEGRYGIGPCRGAPLVCKVVGVLIVFGEMVAVSVLVVLVVVDVIVAVGELIRMVAP